MILTLTLLIFATMLVAHLLILRSIDRYFLHVSKSDNVLIEHPYYADTFTIAYYQNGIGYCKAIHEVSQLEPLNRWKKVVKNSNITIGNKRYGRVYLAGDIYFLDENGKLK